MKFNLFTVGAIALCFLQQIQAETPSTTDAVPTTLDDKSIQLIVNGVLAGLSPELTTAIGNALKDVQQVQGGSLVRRDVGGTVQNGGYGSLDEKVTNELIKRGIIAGDATNGDLLGLKPLLQDLLKEVAKLEKGILKNVVPDVTKIVADVNGVVGDLVTIVKSIDLSGLTNDVRGVVKNLLVNVAKLLEFLGAEVEELSKVIDQVLGDVISKNPVTGDGDITLKNVLDLVNSILNDVNHLLGSVDVDGLLQSVLNLVEKLVNGLTKGNAKPNDATEITRGLLRRNLIKRAAARNAAL